MAAHFPEHRLGRVDEPRRQSFEGRRIEESRRQSEGLGQRMHGRLVSLEVDRENPRQRPGGQIGAGQRALDQLLELARRNAAFATHPQRKLLPVKHQGVFIAGIRRIGYPHRERCIGLKLDAGTPQPLGLALQTATFSGQQPGHERLVVVRVRKHPAGWRVVQRDLPAGLAGGGNRGGCAQRFTQPAAELVGAAVTTEQRHDGTAVFRDSNDRRFPAFVGEDRREAPYQDACGAHAYYVDARREQPPQLGTNLIELNVGARNPGGITVNPRAGQARPDPSGRQQALLGEYYDCYRVRHSMHCPARSAPR